MTQLAVISIGALLYQLPSILDGFSKVAQAINPSVADMKKNEENLILGHVEHYTKVLQYFGKMFNLSLNFRDSYENMSELLKDQSSATQKILRKYHEGLLKPTCEYLTDMFFSGSYIDETGIDISNYLKTFEYHLTLDDNYFLASSELSKMGNYCLAENAISFGEDRNYSFIINTIIDDAILALTRLYPHRVVCPNDEFTIFPKMKLNLKYDWSDSLVKKIKQTSNEITITFTDEFSSLFKLYEKMYTLYLNIQICKYHSYFLSSDSELIYSYLPKIEINNSDSVVCIVPLEYKNMSLMEMQFKHTIEYELKSLEINQSDYLNLHNLKQHDVTFADLLIHGNYELKDPIFEVKSIINNVIGTAQHSLHMSLVLLHTWIREIKNKDQASFSKIVSRYPFIASRLTLTTFQPVLCNLTHKRLFKDTSKEQLQIYWDRLINDLKFMRKFILHTRSGGIAIKKILSNQN